MNQQIRLREVLVVDENGNQLGVIPTEQAVVMARERQMDLVEVAPDVRPPVCRMMDFGRFKYDQRKKEQEGRKKAHAGRMKEVRLRPRIDAHDLETKMRRANEFLADGYKLLLTMIFRGRENAHKDLGRARLEEILQLFAETAGIEKPITSMGRRMTAVLAPKPGLRKPPKGDASSAKSPERKPEPPKEP